MASFLLKVNFFVEMMLNGSIQCKSTNVLALLPSSGCSKMLVDLYCQQKIINV